MFVGLHALLAERTNTPEIEITEDEGASFMKAATKVMRHYSVETTQKTLDWIAFAGITAGIYMPRVAAIGMRKKFEAQSKEPQPFQNMGEGGTIVPFSASFNQHYEPNGEQ